MGISDCRFNQSIRSRIGSRKWRGDLERGNRGICEYRLRFSRHLYRIKGRIFREGGSLLQRSLIFMKVPRIFGFPHVRRVAGNRLDQQFCCGSRLMSLPTRFFLVRSQAAFSRLSARWLGTLWTCRRFRCFFFMDQRIKNGTMATFLARS